MRFALISLLGAALMATPAAAQGYYQMPGQGYPGMPQPYGYGQAPPGNAWEAARAEAYRAQRAEEIARWRAANGDYEGANRARFWAEQHLQRAHQAASMAQQGW